MLNAGEAAGLKLLWHKIACIIAPDTQKFGRYVRLFGPLRPSRVRCPNANATGARNHHNAVQMHAHLQQVRTSPPSLLSRSPTPLSRSLAHSPSVSLTFAVLFRQCQRPGYTHMFCFAKECAGKLVSRLENVDALRRGGVLPVCNPGTVH